MKKYRSPSIVLPLECWLTIVKNPNIRKIKYSSLKVPCAAIIISILNSSKPIRWQTNILFLKEAKHHDIKYT
uniref:Ovule protein n=1 Tax=Heterorhabditis bacteriophora TaxID=37862 RepID=A0A1I7WI05_HETBA